MWSSLPGTNSSTSWKKQRATLYIYAMKHTTRRKRPLILTKTPVIILLRKYKVTIPKSLGFSGVGIECAPSVKYLGVYLDTKLHWKQFGKTYGSLWVCRRVMDRHWGFNPKVNLLIDSMFLLSQLLHTVVIRGLLKSFPENFLNTRMGAIITTPTDWHWVSH